MLLAEKAADLLTKAGMDADDPFRQALILTTTAAEMALAAVQTGARGLTPEGEEDLIQRMAQAGERAMAQQAYRLVRMHAVKLALSAAAILVAVVLGAAFGGYWYGGVRADVPDEWRRLIEQNDIQESLKHCTGAALKVQGDRRACAVPLWVNGLER